MRREQTELERLRVQDKLALLRVRCSRCNAVVWLERTWRRPAGFAGECEFWFVGCRTCFPTAQQFADWLDDGP